MATSAGSNHDVYDCVSLVASSLHLLNCIESDQSPMSNPVTARGALGPTDMVAEHPPRMPGQPAALSSATEAIYHELKRIAAWRLGKLDERITLDPTELAHEALLRVDRQRITEWDSPTHLLAVAAMMVRRVLMNHLRARQTIKRGGGRKCRLIVDTASDRRDEQTMNLMALDIALTKLGMLDSRQLAVVELRFFGGMSVREIGHILDMSDRSVEAAWSHARLWLARELKDG